MNGKHSFRLSGQCRLCLLRDGTVPVFSDSGTITVSLKQKISVCLSLEVSVIWIVWRYKQRFRRKTNVHHWTWSRTSSKWIHITKPSCFNVSSVCTHNGLSNSLLKYSSCFCRCLKGMGCHHWYVNSVLVLSPSSMTSESCVGIQSPH